MTDERSALSISAVIDRFAESERLLAVAAERVQSLGDATRSASESSTALTQAARGITTASDQVVAMTTAMKTGHDALVDAMGIARQFLETTDVSAIRNLLASLDGRMAGMETAQVELSGQLAQATEDHAQRLNTMSGTIDRSAVLERERDEARARLANVMQQIPARVAKRIN